MTGWNGMQKNDNATYFVQYQENKNNITIKLIGSQFHCQLKKVEIFIELILCKNCMTRIRPDLLTIIRINIYIGYRLSSVSYQDYNVLKLSTKNLDTFISIKVQ